MTNLFNSLSQISWLEPWRPEPAGLEIELEKEIDPSHPLFGQKAISVARRVDTDDVLFYLPDLASPLAEVHLTWKGSVEKDPQWPWTTFYSSVVEWIEKSMKRDHQEYLESAQDL
jgi:hypothetical protein